MTENVIPAPVREKVRIERVEAIALQASFADEYGTDSVPSWLLRPAASHGVMPRAGQYACIVKVYDEDGRVGVGECYGLPAPQVTATIVANILAPLVVGEDAMASTALWQRMFDAQAPGGRTRGFYLEAIAGLDMALWDLRGKVHGLPVHRLMGGPVRTSIPCYASPVPLHDDVTESAQHALDYVAQGFRALKVKIGRGARVDRAHLSAVRDAVGEDIEILTDANCAYRLDEATRVGYVLRDLGIGWFEEPLPVDDLAGLAELRRRTGLTMVNGETQFSSYDLRDTLTAGAIDVYMPNLARCGGLTEAQRIAALAAAFHVDIAPHGVGSVVSVSAALQLMASVPNVRTYEYNRLPNPLRDRLALTFPRFADGALEVPDLPGLGVELDEAAVDTYTIGIW